MPDTTTITGFDDGMSTLWLAADADFEIASLPEESTHDYVVGFDEGAEAERNDAAPNTWSDDALDGEWNHCWYFDDTEWDTIVEDPFTIEDLADELDERIGEPVRVSNGLIRVDHPSTAALEEAKNLDLHLSYVMGDGTVTFVHDEHGDTEYPVAYRAD